MKTSDSIDKLAPALVAAQSEMPIVERDGSAEVERGNGEGSTKQYQYTSLGSMLQTVRPILSKHGLAVIQGGDGEHVDGHICMETTIIHESGQYLCGTMRIPFTQGSNAAQAAGAAITYCRRYAFSSMLGVTSEEDTDAGKPVAKKAAPPPGVKAQPARPAKPPVAEKAEPTVSLEEQSQSTLTKAMASIVANIEKIGKSPENKAEYVAKIRTAIQYAESLESQGKLTKEHLTNLKDMTEEVLNEAD
jgi:hypothetical protein